MGFLTDGNTLNWSEVQKYCDYIRKHGIKQFLAIYEKTKNRSHDCLKFGDEIEYVLISLNDKEKKVKLSLRAAEILDELMREELEGKGTAKTLWRPEYARYMVEGTPGAPYGDCVTELRRVELNMKLRRLHVQHQLLPHERLLSLSVFPLMGVGAFTDPAYSPQGPVAQSLFTPDEVIFQHKRFPTLSQNIRERRGSKVCITVPVYRDERTVPPQPTPPTGNEWDIYMDSMAFGMGMCCLQTTFQCEDINEARKFYDQLAMMCPIMLALTAASPIYRGYLSDIDVRWGVIAASVDDRTPEERGLQPLEHDKFVIKKSRYDSIDCFIANDEALKPEYNDLDLVYDHEIYAQLREGGIDDLLARHLAHLFIRDPLVVYDDKIELDDTKQSDHFENIQSTNWQTVRFKPPPPNSDIGWRTEFRPMEVQLTDFENAAFVVFMVLLTRTIRSFNVNFYIPITKVDENMRRAHDRGAALNQRFYFRKVIHKGQEQKTVPKGELTGFAAAYDSEAAAAEDNTQNYYEEMSINQIINGDENFAGLMPLVRHSALLAANSGDVVHIHNGAYANEPLNIDVYSNITIRTDGQVIVSPQSDASTKRPVWWLGILGHITLEGDLSFMITPSVYQYGDIDISADNEAMAIYYEGYHGMKGWEQHGNLNLKLTNHSYALAFEESIWSCSGNVTIDMDDTCNAMGCSRSPEIKVTGQFYARVGSKCYTLSGKPPPTSLECSPPCSSSLTTLF
ncbi:glutamatecysteine ligase, catalytic subunit [Acanthamoeba castellanii str. Neff]|uniref:Glutamate--cysteine ligase n=1 Tax=Acanthamoeba castellanii (strain ATCC 30010 / Neff) TaxID=1257118 RepID=L8HFP6_ACACF|nr:glutamatecysteine ligase, catalytic subunit [Acanthamoeba castellanii str. Neff]ELR24354.1 glutamatecysteine ligase, catalytic subunit [Acanthamoeba castellanii str. Neff]